VLANLAHFALPAERVGRLRAALIRAIDGMGEPFSHLPLKDYPLLREAQPAPYYYDWLAHPNDDAY
jgi:hypothetical protein